MGLAGVFPTPTLTSVRATSRKRISWTLPQLWMIPPLSKNNVARNIQVAPAKSMPRTVETTHILGSCHSTGARAYGALSYAIAMVPRSAKSAMNTMRSARILSLSMIMDNVK